MIAYFCVTSFDGCHTMLNMMIGKIENIPDTNIIFHVVFVMDMW